MAEGSNANAVGRLAGIAYLAVIAFSSAGYLTLARLLTGDSQAVRGNLAASPALFTPAVVASVIGAVAWLVLALLLYRLMSAAGKVAALLMVTFTVAGVGMGLFALTRILPLAGSIGAGLDAGGITAMVASYNRVLLLAQIFSGLWLFPFGWLVVHSRAIPRVFGVCLIVGGFWYVALFATAFAPTFDQTLVFRTAAVVAGAAVYLGEFGTCVWLLIKGAREYAANSVSRTT